MTRERKVYGIPRNRSHVRKSHGRCMKASEKAEDMAKKSTILRSNVSQFSTLKGASNKFETVAYPIASCGI